MPAPVDLDADDRAAAAIGTAFCGCRPPLERPKRLLLRCQELLFELAVKLGLPSPIACRPELPGRWNGSAAPTGTGAARQHVRVASECGAIIIGMQCRAVY